MSHRPLRLCDSCLKVDDHPRHVHGLAGDRSADPRENVTYTDDQRRAVLESIEPGDTDALMAMMRDLEDRATQMKHLDCCLSDGCPDGSCVTRQNNPKDPFDGGKTVGQALIDQLEKAAQDPKVQPVKIEGGIPPIGLSPVPTVEKDA